MRRRRWTHGGLVFVAMLLFVDAREASATAPLVEGKVVFRLPKPRAPTANESGDTPTVTSALSRDGRWLALGRGDESSVTLWALPKPGAGTAKTRPRRPRRRFQLAKHRSAKSTLDLNLAFATGANSELLLLSYRHDRSDYGTNEGGGARDDRLRVWRVRDGKLLLDVTAPVAREASPPSSGRVALTRSQQFFSWSVRAVDKNRTLLVAEFRNAFHLYELQSGRRRCSIGVGEPGNVGDRHVHSALSDDGRHLAVLDSGTLTIHQTTDCRTLARREPPTCRRGKGRRCNGGSYLEFSTAGLIVSNGVGAIYDTKRWKQRKRFDHRRWVDGSKFTPSYWLVRPEVLRLKTRRGWMDIGLRRLRVHQYRAKLAGFGIWREGGQLWVGSTTDMKSKVGARRRAVSLVWDVRSRRGHRLVGPEYMPTPSLVRTTSARRIFRAIGGGNVLEFEVKR